MGEAQFKVLEVGLHLRPQLLEVGFRCDIAAYRVADCVDHGSSLRVTEAGCSERLGSLECVKSEGGHGQNDEGAAGLCQEKSGQRRLLREWINH